MLFLRLKRRRVLLSLDLWVFFFWFFVLFYLVLFYIADADFFQLCPNRARSGCMMSSRLAWGWNHKRHFWSCVTSRASARQAALPAFLCTFDHTRQLPSSTGRLSDCVRLQTFGKQRGVTVSCSVAMLILSEVRGSCFFEKAYLYGTRRQSLD